MQGTTRSALTPRRSPASSEQSSASSTRLFMSAGVRVEDNSAFGRSTTERGSLAYVVKEWGTWLHGGAGGGFRTPTFNDLFFPGFSNPAILPEKSFSWDVGGRASASGDRVRLDLTFFHSKFTNLTRLLLPLPGPRSRRPRTSERSRSARIEFASEVVILDNPSPFNYTYTDTENLLTDQLLPREPAPSLERRPHLGADSQALALRRGAGRHQAVRDAWAASTTPATRVSTSAAAGACSSGTAC